MSRGHKSKLRRFSAPEEGTTATPHGNCKEAFTAMRRSTTRIHHRSKSILLISTVDESLHSVYGDGSAHRKSSRRGSISSDEMSVSFTKVNIREYDRAIGDNPSCSSGPPIGIGWRYDPNECIVPIDEYEAVRPIRRGMHEMIIPRSVREDILMEDCRVSRGQIASAVRQSLRTKSHRRRTVQNLGKMSRVEEFVESAIRKIKRILFCQRRDREKVRMMMEEAEEASRISGEEEEEWLKETQESADSEEVKEKEQKEEEEEKQRPELTSNPTKGIDAEKRKTQEYDTTPSGKSKTPKPNKPIVCEESDIDIFVQGQLTA